MTHLYISTERHPPAVQQRRQLQSFMPLVYVRKTVLQAGHPTEGALWSSRKGVQAVMETTPKEIHS